MTCYESRDGRLRLFRGDSHHLHPITSGSVGVILTSPPYWVKGRGRPSAERYARDLAVGFGREWKRVLAPDGDLWLVIAGSVVPGGAFSRAASGRRHAPGSAGTTA